MGSRAVVASVVMTAWQRRSLLCRRETTITSVGPVVVAVSDVGGGVRAHRSR